MAAPTVRPSADDLTEFLRALGHRSSTRLPVGRTLTALLCSMVWSATGLVAQSITRGDLHGLVVDPSGQFISQARVVAASLTSGWERTALTARSGKFQFTQVPPGEYELLVEIIGYGPVRVVDIPIRPGQDINVPVTIAPAVPPVLRVDTVSLDIGLTGIVKPGSGRWLQGDAVNDFPDRLRTISSLSSLSPRFDPSLGAEGLPASMTQTFVDGVPRDPQAGPRRRPAGDPPRGARRSPRVGGGATLYR